jgi:predicted alpha/beta hydrolase family esterase
MKELEKRGCKCISPTFPEAKDPRYPAWRDLLLEQISANWEGNELYFVGHSMGGYLILRLFGEFADAPWMKSCKGILLVSAACTKRPEWRPFYGEDVNWGAFKKIPVAVIAIHSKDDSRVGLEHPKMLCESLQGSHAASFEYREVDGENHFVKLELAPCILQAAQDLIPQ